MQYMFEIGDVNKDQFYLVRNNQYKATLTQIAIALNRCTQDRAVLPQSEASCAKLLVTNGYGLKLENHTAVVNEEFIDHLEWANREDIWFVDLMTQLKECTPT